MGAEETHTCAWSLQRLEGNVKLRESVSCRSCKTCREFVLLAIVLLQCCGSSAERTGSV